MSGIVNFANIDLRPIMEFKDLTISDKDELKLIIRYVCDAKCTVSFSNVLGWQSLYRYQICKEDGFTVVRIIAQDDISRIIYFFPIGEGDIRSIVRRIVEQESPSGKNLCFFLPSLKFVNDLRPLLPDFGLHHLRSESDYFYLREDLANLKGQDYQNKRNLVHQFKSKYNYSVSTLAVPDFEECMELYHRWYEIHRLQSASEPSTLRFLEHESNAVKYILGHYDELGQQGLVVRVEGKVVGFTYGVALSDEVFDVQLEKADEEYAGAYAFINQQMASSLPEHFIYLNREEDMGIEGLRKAKLQYRPESLVPKYWFERMSERMCRERDVRLSAYPEESLEDIEQHLFECYQNY